MNTIRAAVVEAAGSDFVIAEPQLADPQPDEVLIKIAAAGICHTDLSVAAGGFPTPFPAVLGHEGAGTVEAVGERVQGLKPGTRVVLSYDFCGHCRNCLAGRPSVCWRFMEQNFRCARDDGSTSMSRNGHPLHSHFLGQSAFATYAIVPARCAIAVESSIPMSTLAPFGCGIQTGAGTVLNALQPAPGDSLAVIGLGAVGMAAVMAAKLLGAEVIIAVDPVAGRRSLAAELGATHTIDPNQDDVVAAVRDITSGGVEYSIEASGVSGVLRTAIDVLASGGTCGVVGAPTDMVEASINVLDLVSTGRTIRGVLLGAGVPSTFLPELVAHWESGRLPVERLVTEFALEDINIAVRQARSGAVVKPVLNLHP